MNKQYTIKEICIELKLSEVYVRRMIHHGKIKTTKVEIAKNTFKHQIAEDELNRWRKETSGRSKREDGRSKFTLYATADEYDKIQKLLETESIESPLIRTNKVKNVTE